VEIFKGITSIALSLAGIGFYIHAMLNHIEPNAWFFGAGLIIFSEWVRPRGQ